MKKFIITNDIVYRFVHIEFAKLCCMSFLPRCMECRRGLAMKISSVCLSVCLSNAWFVTKRKKIVPAFL